MGTGGGLRWTSRWTLNFKHGSYFLEQLSDYEGIMNDFVPYSHLVITFCPAPSLRTSSSWYFWGVNIMYLQLSPEPQHFRLFSSTVPLQVYGKIFACVKNMFRANIVLKCETNQNGFKIHFIPQRNKQCVSIAQRPIGYCCVRKSSFLVWESQEMLYRGKQEESLFLCTNVRSKATVDAQWATGWSTWHGRRK